MKTPKIKSVEANNRKKSLIIQTSKGEMTLPYSKLRTPPSSENKIVEIFPDREIKNEGITYQLEDGTEETVHVDVFLNFNKDPDYIRELALYDLTIQIQKQRSKLKVPISELSRRLNTSRSQIHRLLDQTNYKKTLDSMLDLACALGLDVEINCAA